jgi:pre-mRNA cleavage complex 2 protein Pcf11
MQPGISIDALNDDIQRLITASKAQLAQSPHDPSIQTRLKALMDLQTILQTQNLPPDQLVLVKNQIADLAVTIRAPSAQTSTPTPVPQPVAVAPPPIAAPPKVTLDSILGSGSLAALMARNSATPQVSTPQPPPASVAIRSPPPQRAEPQKSLTPAPPDPLALMNMLRQAGMLPAATPVSGPTPVPSATPAVPLPFPFPLPGTTPGIRPSGPPNLETITSDIALKASSLKQYVYYDVNSTEPVF